MTQKKKILFAVEAMGGGVFTYIVALANGLVDIFDVYVAHGVREQTPTDFQNYFDDRIHLIEVKNFTRSINPVKDIKAFCEIRKISKEINPDIIHLHSSKAGALGRCAFNGRKIPLFYTPHGYSFLMQDHSAAKRLIYKAIEAVCAKRCCTTISCSKGEHQETLKLTQNAMYVNNGIGINDLKTWIDAVQISKGRDFTVFTLGRICTQKNPALYNQIALALPNVRFLWIGEGELRNELTAPNIEVTGWVSREEALKNAMQADVFLLTSLWEGLPISLLEAMYMKKICVVSNVIGNRDVIKHKKNGFVCDNVEEYIAGILAAREGKCREMADCAYMDIVSNYNTDVMVQKYRDIYESRI